MSSPPHHKQKEPPYIVSGSVSFLAPLARSSSCFSIPLCIDAQSSVFMFQSWGSGTLYALRLQSKGVYPVIKMDFRKPSYIILSQFAYKIKWFFILLYTRSLKFTPLHVKIIGIKYGSNSIT